MTTKVGLLTSVRWAQLDPKARLTAIKGRLKGGGAQNPHATLLSVVRRHLTGRASIREVARRIKLINDPEIRKDVRRGFKTYLRLFRSTRPVPVKVRKSDPFQGPRGRLIVTTQPDAVIQDGRYRRHLGLWANIRPKLTARGALVGLLLMRQSCETDPDCINTFEIVDLRNEEIYSIEASDADDQYEALQAFVKDVEDEISKLS